jgi:hypothetical protein
MLGEHHMPRTHVRENNASIELPELAASRFEQVRESPIKGLLWRSALRRSGGISSDRERKALSILVLYRLSLDF